MSVINAPPDPPLRTYEVPQATIPPVDPPKPKPQPDALQTRQSAPSTPTTIVNVPADATSLYFEVNDNPTVVVDPLPPAPTPSPEPTIVNMTKGASPRGNFGEWFPQNSYPPAALRAQAEGRVGVALTVLASGRVGGCEVATTSGNADLDQATCRLALKNGRFQPARDAQGNAVETRIILPPVRWRIEK
jgi:protein TonB